ncbi:uncharacterized protein [Arachis hypogaea]|uniref:uncharacterized protein n=1 Tax=Arachis hypogaea TaxID=3818 RepID=UPI003B219ADF
MGDDLYKRGFSRPLLKCLGPSEAEAAIAEVHDGICGPHTGCRSLATKILRAGWPFYKWGMDILGPFSISPGKFIDEKIALFLTDLHIKHHFSSIEHPQSNELTEAANKIILQALKKKLTNAKGRWAELIPKIPWSYNTTRQSTTNETPFRLVYDTDSMIPMEIAQGSSQTEYFSEDANMDARLVKLDTISEERSLAEIQ